MSLVVTNAKGTENFCGECENFIPAGATSVGHTRDGIKTLHLVHRDCAQKRDEAELPRCSLCADAICRIADAKIGKN